MKASMFGHLAMANAFAMISAGFWIAVAKSQKFNSARARWCGLSTASGQTTHRMFVAVEKADQHET
jgi:hypothetical protein